MKHDIAAAAAAYVTLRIALLAGLSYLFFRVLQSGRRTALAQTIQLPDPIRANRVPDDRC